jgi:hypothetical protein
MVAACAEPHRTTTATIRNNKINPLHMTFLLPKKTIIPEPHSEQKSRCAGQASKAFTAISHLPRTAIRLDITFLQKALLPPRSKPKNTTAGHPHKYPRRLSTFALKNGKDRSHAGSKCLYKLARLTYQINRPPVKEKRSASQQTSLITSK